MNIKRSSYTSTELGIAHCVTYISYMRRLGSLLYSRFYYTERFLLFL
jgi:hypothetical protein